MNAMPETDTQPGLFPEIAAAETIDPYEGMGHDARRTAKQLESIAAGVHPGTYMRIRSDAATAKDGPGLRCRDCRYLWRKSGHFQGVFLKCEKTAVRGDVRSTGPDMRGWWPACSLFEAKVDGL